MCFVHRSVCNVQCAVCNVQRAVCNVQYAVCYVQYAVGVVQYILHSAAGNTTFDRSLGQKQTLKNLTLIFVPFCSVFLRLNRFVKYTVADTAIYQNQIKIKLLGCLGRSLFPPNSQIV